MRCLSVPRYTLTYQAATDDCEWFLGSLDLYELLDRQQVSRHEDGFVTFTQ